MTTTPPRLCLAALALFASAAFAASLTGSGRMATETRAVSGFTGVALGVPGRLAVGGSGDIRRLGASPS